MTWESQISTCSGLDGSQSNQAYQPEQHQSRLRTRPLLITKKPYLHGTGFIEFTGNEDMGFHRVEVCFSTPMLGYCCATSKNIRTVRYGRKELKFNDTHKKMLTHKPTHWHTNTFKTQNLKWEKMFWKHITLDLTVLHYPTEMKKKQYDKSH